MECTDEELLFTNFVYKFGYLSKLSIGMIDMEHLLDICLVNGNLTSECKVGAPSGILFCSNKFKNLLEFQSRVQ